MFTGIPPALKRRAAYALMAAALAALSSQWIFLGVPTGSDERSYIFQAHNFSEGRIARPAPVIEEAFEQQMIILDGRAGWLSRYPPGHPLWLAPGVWIGSVYVMVALAAALGMWFVCAGAAALRIPEHAAAVPLLLSPFFVFMYGTLLSHTSGFMATACLLWAYLRWRESGIRRYAALAGLAWSFFFLNRTYTALLMAMPFGLDAIVHGWLRRTDRRALMGVAIFAACSAAGVLIYLVYNKAAVGDPFTATYLYYAPTECLGFGPRRLEGNPVHHTLARGLAQLARQWSMMNEWALGFRGSFAAWAALMVIGWSRQYSPLLLGATAVVWLGYVYFWYGGVDTAGGPAYFFETLPMAALAGALGIRRLWAGAAAFPRARLAAAALVVIALASNSASFSHRHARIRRAQQAPRRALADTMAALPPHALLIVENLRAPHSGEAIVNPRGLDSDPLVARSLHAGNQILMRQFAHRTPYLLHGDPGGPAVRLEPPARIEIGRSLWHAEHAIGRLLHSTNAEDRLICAASQAQDAAGWLARGLAVPLARGRYEVLISGSCESVADTQPVEIDLRASHGRVQPSHWRIVGSQPHPLLRAEIEVDADVTHIEPRIAFGGSGTLLVQRITFRELR